MPCVCVWRGGCGGVDVGIHSGFVESMLSICGVLLVRVYICENKTLMWDAKVGSWKWKVASGTQ